ncbi:MAG: hypothetical protein PHO62_00725 [Sulfurimonas sp.]|uniref:hypothetical protein n=1 Tax=Sulfurimonas sp. TaxID=2022749 RepID=UPI00260425E8|nr:hypothetical protein [Sulfurimonas sp.]MDD5371930.1 hypothetical protein [Sulfurimonas sp.]
MTKKEKERDCFTAFAMTKECHCEALAVAVSMTGQERDRCASLAMTEERNRLQ